MSYPICRNCIDTIYTLDELKSKILPILKNTPQIEEAWIFGSYVRGDALSDSDVDIAVRVSDGLMAWECQRITDPIMEVLQKDLDVFEIRQFKNDDFMRGAVKIYDKKLLSSSE